MKFNTKEEMMYALSDYKRYLNEYEHLTSKLSIHSPSFGGIPSQNHADKSHVYNDTIARRDEVDAKLKEIESMVLSLKAIDDMSYRIIWYKFIEGMTLEDISDMLCYSLSHIQHVLYPKAKSLLFEMTHNVNHSLQK